MSKKITILLLAALLTACSNANSSNSQAESKAVSETTTSDVTTTDDSEQTTTTTTEIAVTSAKERNTETTTSKETSGSQSTTADSTTTTITTKSSQNTTGSSKTPASSVQRQQLKPANTTTTTTTTKAAPKTQPQNNVVWSSSMKVWRKLCEGKNLTAAEQEMIRSEIASYAYAAKFQGKTKIHVSFATDSYDISYVKPINLKRNKNMLDWNVYAHLDASVDMDCRGIINYAKSEKQIYDVVAQTRNDALHLIDHGLHSNYQISKLNHCLDYASEIEYNIGFDGTYLWFLTKE